ncbi:hypothetical protein AV521_05595 [Streptomyces sp. IMTB 2501]|uniref:uracil-DNA glycosylase family protein n=1 Tax=Streptomyces sp. IMTB 2501 TaxID=1776340 RepID=UPI00096ECF72|nr:uracil-DNA glycosylase family protein [Streptomyces sp. IMTB 2501]OLZ73529.1 hypothetical protein AV521_05595 [Streptomyces sp. IMTB 2501]
MRGVPGGDPDAGVLLLGEQPGNQEDRPGRPFAGAAGKVLRRASRTRASIRHGSTSPTWSSRSSSGSPKAAHAVSTRLQPCTRVDGPGRGSG